MNVVPLPADECDSMLVFLDLIMGLLGSPLVPSWVSEEVPYSSYLVTAAAPAFDAVDAVNRTCAGFESWETKEVDGGDTLVVAVQTSRESGVPADNHCSKEEDLKDITWVMARLFHY